MRYQKGQSRLKKNSSNKPYNTHMKFMYVGIIFLILGFKFRELFVIAVLLELAGVTFVIKNWKRIDREYNERKQFKKK